MIQLREVSKSVRLHNQGSIVIEVLSGVSLAVAPGECVALTGASCTEQSTLLRMIYGNSKTLPGEVLGYVSQAPRADSVPADVAKACVRVCNRKPDLGACTPGRAA